MSDTLNLAWALLAGALLGTFFFGGLWWTVQRGIKSESPALWFVGSMVVRTATVLAGFYLVARGHWSQAAACFLGFLIARVVVVKRLTRAPGPETSHVEEVTRNAH